MSTELERLSQILRETAEQQILPRWHRAQGDRKADGSLVTEADLAAQEQIAATLAHDFPGIPMLGEEMSPEAQAAALSASDRALWVLDPLDGTSNYAGGFPFFSISLALIEGGRPSLGIVLDPVHDECFQAARGGGARLDGAPIRPRAPSRLADCLAMIDLKRLAPESIPALLKPASFGSQRNLGSVALDWCWLASGRFHLYLHGGQKLWDYAAGRLIADEAGVAWMHLDSDGSSASERLTLEPQLAIAAASQGLLSSWLEVTGVGRAR